MKVFVVERYGSGLTPEVVKQAATRVGAQAPVTHVASVCVPGDDAALSLFTATTSQQLESAVRAEGTTYERIVEAVLIDTDGDPESVHRMSRNNQGH